MSGSAPGVPSNTTSQVTTSNIPDYLKPYASAMLGGAMKQAFTTKGGRVTGTKPYVPFSAMGGQDYETAMSQAGKEVAGFTPMQQQAFQGIGGLQMPGQYDTATQAITGAGLGTLGTAQQAGGLANQALGYGANAASMAGLGYGAQGAYNQAATDPRMVQAFMNPYVQASLNPQLQVLAQQTGIQSAQQQGAATSSGAFGGSRAALQSALTQQAGNLAAQQAIGQGYNQAYDQAMKSMQYGAGLGIQGLQAGLQAEQTGLQGVQNALQAQQLGLQGYGQLGQLGATLSDVGGRQLEAQKGILSTQLQAGGTQQQQQQNLIDAAMKEYQTAQDYPYRQYEFLSSLLRGFPMSNQTSQMYQAAPNPWSQAAGLGVAGLGMYNAMKG